MRAERTGGVAWDAWGDASEEEQEMFLRAWTREEAKRAIQDRFPNATFYR